MPRASNTQSSILAFSIFAFVLSATITGTAGHVLASYKSQQTTDPWWLPVWPSHFDARGLKTLIGASTSLVVVDTTLCGATFGKAVSKSAVIV